MKMKLAILATMAALAMAPLGFARGGGLEAVVAEAMDSTAQQRIALTSSDARAKPALNGNMHTHEVHPRKDKRGLLIAAYIIAFISGVGLSWAKQ